MTTPESSLVAGRELDALVAEKVMGWASAWEGVSTWLVSHKDSPLWSELPRYSTDIAAAWKVVEHMRELAGEGFAVWFVPHHHFSWQSPEHWEAGYTTESCEGGWMPQVRDLAAGDTAPLAICRAALAAVDHSP